MVFDKVTLINTNMNMSQHQKNNSNSKNNKEFSRRFMFLSSCFYY